MNDIAERIDLNRFAADGCPHGSGETQTFDLLEVWGSLDDEWGDEFIASFESGGEG